MGIESLLGAGASILGGVMSSDASSEAAQSAADSSAAATNYATNIQNQQYQQTRSDQAPWRNVGSSAINRLGTLMGISTAGDPNAYRQQLVAQLMPQFTSNVTQSSGQGSLLYNADDPTAQPISTGTVTSTSPVVNWSALNSEVDRQMAAWNANNAAQSKSPDYGSLTKNFTMADFKADPGYAFRLSEGLKSLDRSAAARGGLLSGATLKGITRYSQDAASQEYGNAYNRYQTNQGNLFNRLSALSGSGQTAVNQLAQTGQSYANNVGNLAVNNANTQGNAALAAGQANASMYQGIGNALGNINWGSLGTSNNSTWV